VPTYELVASRQVDIGDAVPHVGMEIPGPGDTVWRVIDIDTVTDFAVDGAETSAQKPTKRLICEILP
jgi:hypothetical protein